MPPIIENQDFNPDAELSGRRQLESVMLNEASPSMSITTASGRAIFAPMAAGSPNPIVPAPPEVIMLRGVGEAVMLRGPHLVLADASGDDSAVAKVVGHFAEPFDHVLRIDPVTRLGMAVRVWGEERILVLPGIDLAQPFGSVVHWRHMRE
jgi:hypothetical protein